MANFKKRKRGGVAAPAPDSVSGEPAKRYKKPFNPDDSEKATLSALRSLARADQSRQELTHKLVFKGYAPAVVEQVLTELTKAGWLNDDRALDALITRQSARKIGPLRIKAESRQKGFDPQKAKVQLSNVIEQAASSETAYWEHQALEALTRRFKSQPLADDKSRQQALRFLAQRGFTFAHSREAVKRYQQQCGADERWDEVDVADPSDGHE